MAPIIFDEFETMKWLGLVSRAEPTLAGHQIGDAGVRVD